MALAAGRRRRRQHDARRLEDASALAMRMTLRGGEDFPGADLKSYSPRARQKEYLGELLGSVTPVPGLEECRDMPWKCLKYDSHWRDVLAMCMPPSELSMHGVLNHGHIEDDREMEEGDADELPAAYLISRSARALKEVAKDVEGGRFGSFHLFVSGPTGEKDWEPFTGEEMGVSEEAAKKRLACADDVFCDFIALEEDMFELGIRDCYPHIHQEGVAKDKTDDALFKCADGLLNFLITCGLSPIIRAQKGTPAEQVGRLLEERIASEMAGMTPKSDAKVGVMRRPLVVIADRTADIPIMLHHACTYQALLNDIMGMHVNAVSLVETAPGGAEGEESAKGKGAERRNITVTVPLSREYDTFW